MLNEAIEGDGVVVSEASLQSLSSGLIQVRQPGPPSDADTGFHRLGGGHNRQCARLVRGGLTDGASPAKPRCRAGQSGGNLEHLDWGLLWVQGVEQRVPGVELRHRLFARIFCRLVQAH